MKRLLFAATLVWGLFFAYYAFTAYWLPNGAGPDFPFSRAAADFYHEHNRLARLPEDEANMQFSIYGNTRLLRPPFSYYFAAQFAKLPGVDQLNQYYAYRLSTGFLAALTLAVIFIAVRVYFNSSYLAWLSVLLAGLLPQYAFTASYLNDDTSAFLAISLLTLAMVLIVRKGAGIGALLLFAFSLGLVIISKKSAWGFGLAAFVFYLVYLLRFDRQFIQTHASLLVGFIAGGAWWLLYNMANFGWNDPILSKTITGLMDKYATVDLSGFGFRARGVGMKALVFANYNNFIGATYMAVVGHLDWLKLRVGNLQYGYYGWLVAAMCINLIWLAAKSVTATRQTVEHIKTRQTISLTGQDKGLPFEWILYLAVGLQVVLYTWTNVYNDIQIQGKYILPVILPMLLIALIGARRIVAWLKENGWLGDERMQIALAILVMAAPIIVHLDALFDYVIPFYWPNLSMPVILKLL